MRLVCLPSARNPLKTQACPSRGGQNGVAVAVNVNVNVSRQEPRRLVAAEHAGPRQSKRRQTRDPGS